MQDDDTTRFLEEYDQELEKAGFEKTTVKTPKISTDTMDAYVLTARDTTYGKALFSEKKQVTANLIMEFLRIKACPFGNARADFSGLSKDGIVTGPNSIFFAEEEDSLIEKVYLRDREDILAYLNPLMLAQFLGVKKGFGTYIPSSPQTVIENTRVIKAARGQTEDIYNLAWEIAWKWNALPDQEKSRPFDIQLLEPFSRLECIEDIYGQYKLDWDIWALKENTTVAGLFCEGDVYYSIMPVEQSDDRLAKKWLEFVAKHTDLEVSRGSERSFSLSLTGTLPGWCCGNVLPPEGLERVLAGKTTTEYVKKIVTQSTARTTANSQLPSAFIMQDECERNATTVEDWSETQLVEALARLSAFDNDRGGLITPGNRGLATRLKPALGDAASVYCVLAKSGDVNVQQPCFDIREASL